MVNNSRQRRNKNGRRGVGAIVGGIILMTILVTSVLIYYMGILSADKVKESYDIQSAQAELDKAAEKLDASRFVYHNVTNTYLRTNMTNNGPITLNVAYAVLYCVEGATCGTDPTTQQTSAVLNSGASASTVIGPVTDGYTYRVDLITERGNIVATTECVIDVAQTACRNDPGFVAPDFAISSFPNSVVVAPGGSGTSQITLTSLGLYTGDVDLSVSGIPVGSGVTASFTPPTVTVPAGSTANSVMTIQTLSSTAPNTYTLTITGTDAVTPITRTTSVALTVLGSAKDFTIAAVPNSVVVQAGQSGSSEIDVTSQNAYSGTVNLSVSGIPVGSGIIASPTPSSVLVGSGLTATSTLAIGTTPTTPSGTYKLTITGMDPVLPISHPTTVSVTVLPAASPPDFALSSFPNTLVVTGGGSDATQITVTSLNGFNSAVQLFVCPPNPNPLCSTSAYSGITPSSPNPGTVTPPAGGSATSTISFSTLATTAPGNYNYTITGTSGGISRTTQVRITVLTPVNSENINLDLSNILAPQIQAIFPNPFGLTSDTSKPLWGAVIANPTDHPMNIKKIIISANDPSLSSGNILCNTLGNGATNPVAITPATTWTCEGQGSTYNVLQWKGSVILAAHSAQLFLAQVGAPATASNNDRPAVALNFNVYTDFGQFTKVGYQFGVKGGSGASGNHPMVNVFLSSVEGTKDPSKVVGVVNVQSGQSVTVTASIANYRPSTTVDVGAALIIDVPRAFTNVAVTSSNGFNAPCTPQPPFADGSTQIRCTLPAGALNTAGITNTDNVKTIQFTMTAPTVTTTKEYLLYILGDGTTDGGTFTLGPIAENVIRVTPPP